MQSISTTGVELLTLTLHCVSIIELRDLLVSTKKATTLDDFKLFYEELTFSSPTPNRIRRLRTTSVK